MLAGIASFLLTWLGWILILGSAGAANLASKVWPNPVSVPTQPPSAVKILEVGPEIHPNQPFNVQPDGSSALWLNTNVDPPEGSVIVFEGTQINTVIDHDHNLLTATIPLALTKDPGQKRIWILYPGPKGPQKSPAMIINVQ
jgi:hypothetical protein